MRPAFYCDDDRTRPARGQCIHGRLRRRNHRLPDWLTQRRTGAASAAHRRAAGRCSGTARRVAGPRVHARRVARHGAFPRHRSRARRGLVVGRSHPRAGAADRFVRRRCALRHARSRRRARIGGQARARPRGDPPRHRGVGRGAATRRQQHRDARAVPAHRGPLRAGRPLRRPVARVLRRGACGCGRRPFARPVRARLDGALESARRQRSGAPARQPLAADDRRAHARGRHGELPPAVHGAADPRCAPRQAPRRARRTRRHDLRLVLAPGRPRPLRRVLRRHAAAAAVPPRATARPDARRAARVSTRKSPSCSASMPRSPRASPTPTCSSAWCAATARSSGSALPAGRSRAKTASSSATSAWRAT